MGSVGHSSHGPYLAVLGWRKSLSGVRRLDPWTAEITERLLCRGVRPPTLAGYLRREDSWLNLASPMILLLSDLGVGDWGDR